MTVPKRFSVYNGPPLQAALEATCDDQDGGNKSGRINAIAARYLEIVERSMPTLTVDEWCLICDALRSTIVTDDHTLRMIWAEVIDSERHEGLGTKWGVDADRLGMRLRDMPHPALVAIAEIVTRFWARSDDEREHGELLASVGARISAP